MADFANSADDEDLPSVSPGTLIAGKYRIDSLIGRGGMGSVWGATHVNLGQRVAVKLIARRYASSRDARQRFDLEAKAAAQLRSRFVVQVYDNGETTDGTPYIVMEYLEGEPLDARLTRLGPVPLQQVIPILTQVGRALARAHAIGIVHRDLKPENIFLSLSQDGEGEIAKVLDFGIAKIKRDDDVGSSTKTGAVLGTPLYMSPEQARGLKSVDHRTDLYSLGMVAYTMLTGQPAFTGEAVGDLLVAICTQPLPTIHHVAPWLPPSLDGWLQRACARDPQARFQSADDLVETFCAAAGMARPSMQGHEFPLRDSSGIRPAGGPTPGSGTLPVRAGSYPDASGAAIGSAMTQQSVNTGKGSTTSPHSVTGDDIPKRSMWIPVAALGGVVVIALAGAAFWRFGRGGEHAAVEGGTTATSVAAATAPPGPTAAAPAAPEVAPVVVATVAPSASVPPIAQGNVKPAQPGAPTGALAGAGKGPGKALVKPPAEKPGAPPAAPGKPKSPSGNVDLGF